MQTLPWHLGGYFVRRSSKMIYLTIRFIVVWIFLLCTPALAETTLNDLANWASHAAIDNQLATVDIEVLQQRLQIDRAKQGLSIFAGAGFGNNRAVISNTSTLNYQSANIQLGLRLPLLGSAETLEKSVMSTGLSLQLAQIRRQQTTNAVLRLLYTANAQLYFTTQRIVYDQAFLQTELSAKQMLSARMQAHFLLKSDQLDFLSMFDLAKRELLRDRAEQQAALTILEELTGHTLSGYHPTAPAVFPPKNLESTVLTASNRTPLVQMAEAVLHARKKSAHKLHWEGIDANLVLAQSVAKGIGVPSGFATTIGVQMDMPIDIIHERSVLRREEAALIEQAQLSLKKSQLEAAQNAHAAVSDVRRRNQNMIASWRQLEAAFAAWQIAHLRAHAIAGDVKGKELEKSYSLYQAAIAYSKSQEALARSIIHARYVGGLSLSDQVRNKCTDPHDHQQILPTGSLEDVQNSDVMAALAALKMNWSEEVRLALASGRVPTMGAISSHSQSLGWYIWNTTTLLSEGYSNVQFPRHTRRLELSFTATQMQTLMDQREIAGLRQFIDEAKRTGITVNWLIGDPRLVAAKGRETLMKWLPVIHELGFNGIVLDVERSQLPKNQKITWEAGILKTISAIHRVTDWPITLTINYRELKNKDLINRLLQAGMSNAAVMIYVRNTDRVEQIATPILKSYPNLLISIVQSIEPDLPSDETASSLGQRGAIAYWQNLSRALERFPNFRGVDIQSWQDFYAAKP